MEKNYKIYALRPTAENMECLKDERFKRATKDYLLVYTADEKPKNSIRVVEENLSLDDTKWLFACNQLLLVEEFWEHEQDMAEAMGKRIESLEIALKEQKEIVDNGTDNKIQSNN